MQQEILGHWVPDVGQSYINANTQVAVAMREGQYQPEVEDRTFYAVIMVLPQVGPMSIGMVQHEGPEDKWAYQQTVKPDGELCLFLPEMARESWPNVSAAMVDIYHALDAIANFDC